MYNVVRVLLSSKKCNVCGNNIGSKLPGLTYLKTKVKPLIKSSWFATHTILNVTVDSSRSGAKTGVDKHKSDDTAPIVIVKPSEWARRDFLTPSIRDLIWKDDLDKREFSSIEKTPIVRYRKAMMSEMRMKDDGGLERTLMEKSKVRISIVRNATVVEF